MSAHGKIQVKLFRGKKYRENKIRGKGSKGIKQTKKCVGIRDGEDQGADSQNIKCHEPWEDYKEIVKRKLSSIHTNTHAHTNNRRNKWYSCVWIVIIFEIFVHLYSFRSGERIGKEKWNKFFHIYTFFFFILVVFVTMLVCLIRSTKHNQSNKNRT